MSNVSKEELEENVSGRVLRLKLLEFKDGLDISISTDWKNEVRIKCSVLAIFILINLVLLNYDLLNTFGTTAAASFNLFILYGILSTVQEERLLVVKSFGYQFRKRSVLGRSTVFIPWDKIEDIFINEVISLQRVLYVLTIYTVENERKLIPLFKSTKPRLSCLQKIYQLLKKL